MLLSHILASIFLPQKGWIIVRRLLVSMARSQNGRSVIHLARKLAKNQEMKGLSF